MAEDRYFDKFPIITYNDKTAIDITRRVVFLNYAYKNPFVYYSYEIDSNERADQFCNRYYEDQYKTWIVYHSNNITDPYYEWYIDEDTFNQMIIKKYGSIELAKNKIKYYENNWISSDNIAISAYNALDISLRKYWEPNYNNGKYIQNYKRRKIDINYNTNKLAKYEVANTSFVKDEICDVVLGNSYVGKGQVVYTTDDTLYLQHLSGSFLANSSTTTLTESSYVYGRESEITANLTSTTLITSNIPAIEEPYWSEVSYYGHEMYNNQYNMTIKVLDKKYSKQVSDDLGNLFKS